MVSSASIDADNTRGKGDHCRQNHIPCTSAGDGPPLHGGPLCRIAIL